MPGHAPHNRGIWSTISATIFFSLLLLSTGGCRAHSEHKRHHGEPGIGDDYYPRLGNGGYDVQSYIISLEVDPVSNYVSGTTRISALLTEPLDSLTLDFQGLSVDSVTVNDKAAAFSQIDPKLSVTLQNPDDLQGTFSILVAYHGHPRPITAAGGGWLAGWEHSDDEVINVINEPDGASTWFPNNNHPRDKAMYRFEITVPNPWVVAATGKLIQTEPLGDKTRYVWEMNRPMASYLAAINIGKYSLVTTQGPNEVTIRNYFPPDYPESSRIQFDALPEMMKYLSSLYGDFPFDEYGVVIADRNSPVCTGMDESFETQTLSIHCPAEKLSRENVIVHELAHQWFGDSVSLKDWHDIWLKEGFATYSEWLWILRNKNDQQFKNFVKKKTERYLSSAFIGLPPKDDLYNPVVYTGGALVLHALRMRVGDQFFFQILRTYMERYRYRNAGTDEFIAVAEEISHQHLREAFHTWLYTNAVP